MATTQNANERSRLSKALKERTKELNCLHALARVVEERDSTDELLTQAVRLIPPAWQFSKDAMARIVLRDQTFATEGFEPTSWSMSADMTVAGTRVGFVEVAYRSKHRADDEGPFLKEERALLNTFAERLGHVVERIEDGEALQRERSQMLALFDGIDDVIYVADPETYELLWVNEAARRSWGQDIVGRKCYAALQDRDTPCPFCTNDRIFGDSAGTSYVWEFQNEINKHWYRCADKAIRWHDGRMVRFELASDISSQKNVEQKLAEREQQFRLLTETAKDMIYRMSVPGGEYEYVSPASEDLFGYSPKEFYENPRLIEKAIHPDWRTYFQEQWASVLRGEVPPVYEYQIVHKSGDVRWMNQRNALVRDENGNVIALQGIVTDVTAARSAARQLEKMAAELTKSNEELDRRVAARTAELQTIIDSIPGLVFYKDAENRYVRVNRYVADAHKMTKEQLEGASCYDIYPPELAKAYHEDDLEVIHSGKAKLNIDEPWETDAGTRWVSTSKIPYLDEAGNIIGLIGVSMDVTERRQAEDEIREKSALLERENWIREGQNQLSVQMRGEKSLDQLASDIAGFVTKYVGAQVGAVYVAQEGRYRLSGHYAYRKQEGVPDTFSVGEGLVGQAAADGKVILLDDVPEGYVLVGSGLGQTRPRHIVAVPCLFSEEVNAVIELASLKPLSEQQRDFLDRISGAVGIATQTAQSRARQKELLEETQQQAEELQAQQEELRTTNEELEEQTRRLKESEERLRAQQEEMEVTNEELEEKNDLLQRQKEEVETARVQLQEKAEEVALASKYKSEFLANMSHELRTPLNSLLILARDLADNREGNLTGDQIESAEVIHGSGSDLLDLINEILDLSKIEAGRMEVHPSAIRTEDLAQELRASFRHMAEEKGLTLDIQITPDAPERIKSDRQRVTQVLRNLMSNAVKFTDRGSITVLFSEGASAGHDRPMDGKGADDRRSDPDNILKISVADTGIGISKAQQKAIFEAFQQGDGSTSRQYGGTGLGLSISRELARLLGGEIRLESEPGKGSTFTLYLPVNGPKAAERSSRIQEHPEPKSARPHVTDRKPHVATAQSSIPDDRGDIADSDRLILVIEDDTTFASLLRDTCRERGYKCIVACDGDGGLALAREHEPNGILLDIQLPGLDGWSVLAALKEDMQTRHIPIHVISVEGTSTDAVKKGAIGHATKPITREELDVVLNRIAATSDATRRRVLLVEDSNEMRESVRNLIGGEDVHLEEVTTGNEAIQALRENAYACVILDLGLPDMSGGDILDHLQSEGVRLPPVIIHTSKELTEDQEMDLREYAETIVIKDVRSQERLLDEVSLFLHRVVNRMPEEKKQIIRSLHEADSLLADKKVLIVDDDMRTTFALSKLLGQRGMQTVKAANGEQALAALEREPDIDVVLMDIMMPVLDGHETMRRIRKQEQWRTLPIIALTAKAMPDDRSKCIESGANEYLSKPINKDRLISTLRVWLYR